MKYKFTLTCVFVSLCLLNVSIRAEPLQAATTIVVNSTGDMVADDGQCTLREAITAANTDTASGATGGECVAGSGDDTIDLTGISGTIHLTSPLPNIASNTIFNGPGASHLAVRRDTGGNYRVFTVVDGVSVAISGLTMSNGSTVNDFGGGVYNAGTLTLNHSLVSSNSTQTSVVLGGHGGGIYNAGTLILNESAVENNSVHTTARDSYGGGIYNAGTLTLNQSTVSHNNTFGNKGHGGGIYNAGVLILNNSTISDNSASTSGANGDGGGIKSFGSGSSVTLNNSTVSHNRSNGGGSGGGLWNSNGSVMELNNSTISSNVSTNNGGGINNSMNAALRLANSIISDNSASSRGGGIWNDLGSTAELDNSTVDNNSAHDGGGIFNDNGMVILTNDSIISGNRADISGGGVKNDHDGILKLTNSTISDNSANTVDGGGIDNLGTAQLTNSVVSGNHAGHDGGGIDNFTDSTVTLINTTISDNSADNGGGGINNFNGTVELISSSVRSNRTDGNGGGIKNFENGLVTLTGSTISGNDSAVDGGGISNLGTTRLTNSTISGNSATERGGGIYTDPQSGTVEIGGTILAKNENENCFGSITPLVGYNLIERIDSCIYSGGTGDLIGIDPIISYLQDNGGPTFTHGLMMTIDPAHPSKDSPAIDQVPLHLCPATDQRGKPRPVDIPGVGNDSTAFCDIGAFERQEGETAIDLLSFTAQPATDHVTLIWETGTEVDNAGFNLHRATAAAGPYTKLNDTLIPAQGDPVSGASYTYTDTDVVKGVTYYYKLEDVDIHGVSTFHGPVSATPATIRQVYLPLILK